MIHFFHFYPEDNPHCDLPSSWWCTLFSELDYYDGSADVWRDALTHLLERT